ncbi:MAG: acetate--CoA ligase family protein [Rhodobacteraceae bacterium]|nr:acetate--CoA ligase family protein [Paracoccaceae bacterium]
MPPAEVQGTEKVGAARDLRRLFAPQTTVVVGGGAWCEGIVGAARALGYAGRLVPVHPKRAEVAGLPAVESLSAVEGQIDAAFIGVNRNATIEIVAELAALEAGGAICFASGFSEAEAEDATGGDLQAALVAAAGVMPILGPNCYGFVNALDGAAIWPDQHGLQACARGVAILTQSSNIAINLTMQARGLPVGMVVTCGNQAQTSQAEIALSLLEDPRVTALGLHIEGFGDLRAWEALAARAQELGKALVAVKSGRSEQAQAAALSHTASLAGADAGAAALMARLGIARVDGLAAFLEALKVAHLHGRLPGARLGSISCSGGEAALVADLADGRAVSFPPLGDVQRARLRAALGPMVTLANPLDYHTYIWRDEEAMTEAWAALAAPEIDLILIVLDYPRADRCDPSDWEIATRAAIAAQEKTGSRYAVCATLPELMPEETAQRLMAAGVLAFSGLEPALEAVEALGTAVPADHLPVVLPGAARAVESLSEADAKAALAEHGLMVPRGVKTSRDAAPEATEGLRGPLAVKVLGLDHKTGAGGLALRLEGPADVAAALPDLAEGDLWIEEMVNWGIAELLVGVTRDPAHGFLMTLAAGGTMTELLSDRASFLLPALPSEVDRALASLRMAPVLDGYRGKPAVDRAALKAAIAAIEAYVLDNADTLEEVEVNPLILTEHAAVAVDALIRKAP